MRKELKPYIRGDKLRNKYNKVEVNVYINII